MRTIDLPVRNVLATVKRKYDSEGIDGLEKVFKKMLETYKTEKMAYTANFLMNALHKIDTCASDCFERIDEKLIINCHCNGENMVIPLGYEKEAKS